MLRSENEAFQNAKRTIFKPLPTTKDTKDLHGSGVYKYSRR